MTTASVSRESQEASEQRRKPQGHIIDVFNSKGSQRIRCDSQELPKRLSQIALGMEDKARNAVIVITPQFGPSSSIQPEPVNEEFPVEMICPHHGRVHSPIIDGAQARCPAPFASAVGYLEGKPHNLVLALRNSDGTIEFVNGAREAPPWPTFNEVKDEIKNDVSKAARAIGRFIVK